MRFISTGFYMALSILGLSTISFLVLLGVQLQRGEITPQDLHSVMRLFGGGSRIIIPNDQYQRFLEYSRDEALAREELELNRGLPETRVPAIMRTQETLAVQQENLAVLNRLLASQKTEIENVRSEVEAQKIQVTNLTRALNNEREKNATVERDAATVKLRNMLAEMDAGNIGEFLTQVCLDLSLGGPQEAARIVRDHLSPDFSAEVLGEMPASERQKIIPLLENRFAGVPPDAVVKIFADNQMSAGEQIVYMMQMTPQQALGVYLRLPATIQEQVAPQVLRGS
ncbi:MAG: hypothetical protein LBU79_01960 [Planctomycetota bacterium]|jgi:flagellar motility protein MotE (MotC chaperone)|nr:hypothetical protein [Planctomycetota bacterium]